MSKRNLQPGRSNRRLVIESATARNSVSRNSLARYSMASNESDERSSSGSIAGRRRAAGVRRDKAGTPRSEYTPNKNTFGGTGVSQRSLRLIDKSGRYQNERLSDPSSVDSNRDSQSTMKRQQPELERDSQHQYVEEMEEQGYGYQGRPLSYPQHGQAPYAYPYGQYPPNMMYPPQYEQQPPLDPYQIFMNQQYQISEMQRMEEQRRAEHERHMAETLKIQRQQQELDMKNALLEEEMKREAQQRQLEAERDREQEREREQEQERQLAAERERELLQEPSSDPLSSPSSTSSAGDYLSQNSHNPPLESFLSNEELLAEIAALKKAISASSRTPSSDDELLAMFTKLQVLQDVLEKRDVEIDAAQLLARSFRRQSGRDVGPTAMQVRRGSNLDIAPPSRHSFSRQSSLNDRNSFSRQSSLDEKKSFDRRNSLNENRKSFSRQGSLSDDQSSNRRSSLNENRKSFSRQGSLGDKNKPVSRQGSLSDGGVSFNRQGSLESISSRNAETALLLDSLGSRESKSISRRDSLNEDIFEEDVDISDMYSDEGEDELQQTESDPRIIKLQEQISQLSTNILSKSFSDKTLLVMFDQLDDLKLQLAVLKGIELPPEMGYKFDEAAELEMNPQFREIKKLKPVLRRLLPARTQFAKIEELFNCDIEKESLGEEHERASAQFSLDNIGDESDSVEDDDEYYDSNEEERGDYDHITNHRDDVVSPHYTLDVIGEEEDVSDSDEEFDVEERKEDIGRSSRQSLSQLSSTELGATEGVGNSLRNSPQEVLKVQTHDPQQTQVAVSSPYSAIVGSPSSEMRLSMEGNGERTQKKRNKSGFLMGNPMGSPRPSLEEDPRDSTSSVNSMDRLPMGVNSFRKPSLDIFHSKRK